MDRRRLPTILSLVSLLLVVFVVFSLRASHRLLSVDPSVNSFVRPLLDNSLNRALAAGDNLRPPARLPVAGAAVLLPDWEVLVLLPADSTPPENRPRCVFAGGAATAARRSSGAAAMLCPLPPKLRRIRPFYAPRVAGAGGSLRPPPATTDEMLRWTHLVYESVTTADDVIIFAKGVNSRQGVNRPTADLRCVFFSSGAGAGVSTAVSVSAQEVFRCARPPDFNGDGFVSLAVAGEPALPTVAAYRPSAPSRPRVRRRSRVCACTMVYNAAKFLTEWVTYHAGIGVERFVLYDNGSDDELDSVVSRLGSNGFDVSTWFWPWPKTQEAGFAHCTVSNRDSCEWMAFIDVDEFVFSPSWVRLDRPDRSLMDSIVEVGPLVGQVSLWCFDFGPSGQKEHPALGVTQGYTCRQRTRERHKSIVRVDAIDDSLVNSIHHFRVKEGFDSIWNEMVGVNHYKYQAWVEFKLKFRRRVSTYVADWKEAVNLGSKDRVPGLGFKPVEPAGWANKFCQVNDTRLKFTAQKWFTKGNKLVWQS